MPTTKVRQVRLARGFTYLGLMILVAILAMSAAATVSLGSVARRRAGEEALLFIGDQFRSALKSYYEATPIGQNPYPPTLDALLKDPRYPGVVRHLRQIYADPITGKTDWVPLTAPGGGIMGVSSPSAMRPIKVAGFPDSDRSFEGKTHYSDWVFFYSPSALPAPAGATPPPKS